MMDMKPEYFWARKKGEDELTVVKRVRYKVFYNDLWGAEYYLPGNERAYYADELDIVALIEEPEVF